MIGVGDKVEKLARYLCKEAGVDPDSTERKYVTDGGMFSLGKDEQFAWHFFRADAEQIIKLIEGP